VSEIMSNTIETDKRFIHQMIISPRGTAKACNVKTDSFEEVIYVLQVGEYHRTRNIRVTGNVKVIAKEYVENLTPEYNSPHIEVWKNGEVVGYFGENEKVESKVKKALTKIARGFRK
jgi:hypothetical protein